MEKGRAPQQSRRKVTAEVPSDEVRLAGDDALSDLPELSLAACDKDRVTAVVQDVVTRLVSPIVGNVPCSVAITDERVCVSIGHGDDSGLLVGHEGQTLASVQYLSARIAGKMLGGSLRLQVDAGDYRERQDSRLKELALALAAKVKAGGRPQSTRPLTAYQRRIIHLALENDEIVQTVSKGEGSQRRVIVQLRRQTTNDAGADMNPSDAE
jgi:spoIIIJ-associated protein